MELRESILVSMDRMCLQVGADLLEARRLDPDGFELFLEPLPFGIHTARKLIAIHLAYRDLPAKVVEGLPRPWQAMYALKKFPAEQLQAAIEAGEIGPGMSQRDAVAKAREWSESRPRRTVTDRRSRADIRAGALIDCPVGEMSEPVRRALLRWLDPATNA